MSLDAENLDRLEGFYERILPTVGLAAKGLMKMSEGMEMFRPLWQQAKDCLPQGSLEWRELDKEFLGISPFFIESPTGYLHREDAAKFLKLVYAVGGVLKRNGRLKELQDGKVGEPRLFLPNEEYDSKRKLFEFVENAKHSLTIVDGHLDHKVFDFIDAVDTTVSIKLLTTDPKKSFRSLYEAIMKTQTNIEVRIQNQVHDRFIIVDEQRALHLGTSLNGIGKKAFVVTYWDQAQTVKHLSIFGQWWKEAKVFQ
jgi:hypothetical protein